MRFSRGRNGYSPADRLPEEDLDDLQRLLEKVQELIQTFSSRGYSPNRIEELDLATGDYRRWKEKLLQKWPWLDHEQLKKSFASFERGHFRALKDFLDELQHPANS